MALRKEIILKWDGKEYPLVITMQHIDALDEEVNLLQMVSRIANSDIRFSHAAKIIAMLLSFAGCEVTQEEVFYGMFGDNETTPSDVIEMLNKIMDVIFYNSSGKKSQRGKKRK